MTTVNIYEMAQTWNNGATTFTGIGLNVTDTASAAASLLMDLQVGGTSKFTVNKSGGINLIGTGGSASLAGDFNTLRVSLAGVTSALTVKTVGLTLPATYFYRWSSSGDPNGTADLILARDAANTLAQRNGANAQTFNLYNTYTDASNYERLRIGQTSNTFQIFSEAAGTGTAREIQVGVGTARKIAFPALGGWQMKNGVATEAYFNWDALQVRSDTLIGFSSTTTASTGAGDTNIARVGAGILGVRANSAVAGGALNFLEQTAPSAPSANQVTIYAEDDGAGKTRLMAIFPTGAAQQIAIEP